MACVISICRQNFTHVHQTNFFFAVNVLGIKKGLFGAKDGVSVNCNRVTSFNYSTLRKFYFISPTRSPLLSTKSCPLTLPNVLLTVTSCDTKSVRSFSTDEPKDASGGNEGANGTRRNEVTYEELLELINKEDIRLVDVREPRELEETGCIDSAINIPVTKLKLSLSMPEDEFSQTYGISKPKKTSAQVIFYGLSAVKANTALELAKKSGYEKARHFPGGWTEWEARHADK